MEKSLCLGQPLPVSFSMPSPLKMTLNSFQPGTCSPSTDVEPGGNRGSEGGEIQKGKH